MDYQEKWIHELNQLEGSLGPRAKGVDQRLKSVDQLTLDLHLKIHQQQSLEYMRIDPAVIVMNKILEETAYLGENPRVLKIQRRRDSLLALYGEMVRKKRVSREFYWNKYPERIAAAMDLVFGGDSTSQDPIKESDPLLN